jgi:POT family proton-dependent oligopeptide transporter
MAVTFLILPLGIKLAGVDGKSAFVWLFLSYVLQSIGELLIMPIGYAMIGSAKAVSRRDDGQLDARDPPCVSLCRRLLGHDPRADRHHGGRHQPRYAKLFAELGAGSLVVGVVLVVLIPFLRKLITDKAETPPVETPATVVPVA